MSFFSYGETIRNARKYYGMTQEELAYGICAVSSLSKIENGLQVPHYSTFEALMHKMGEKCDHFVYYMNERDLERRKLLRRIEQNLWKDDFITLKQNFEQLKRITGPEHRLEYQWKCVIEQMIRLEEGEEIHAIEEQLLHIISMTFPIFPEKWSPMVGHTHCELFAMLLIGFCEQKKGNHKKAFDLYQNLLKYAENVVGDPWVEDLQAGIYYLQTCLQLEMKNYRSSATFFRKGVEKCLKREKYHMAARVMSLSPQIMAELEEQKESEFSDFYLFFIEEIRIFHTILSNFF